MSRGPNACWPAAELDGLVADVDRHAALEDVEALVLAVVDVQRDLEPAGAVISTSVYWPPVSAADALTSASMPKNQRCWPRAVGDCGAGWMQGASGGGWCGERGEATIIRGEISSSKCLREITT